MFHFPLVPWSAAERNGHIYENVTSIDVAKELMLGRDKDQFVYIKIPNVGSMVKIDEIYIYDMCSNEYTLFTSENGQVIKSIPLLEGEYRLVDLTDPNWTNGY